MGAPDVAVMTVVRAEDLAEHKAQLAMINCTELDELGFPYKDQC